MAMKGLQTPTDQQVRKKNTFGLTPAGSAVSLENTNAKADRAGCQGSLHEDQMSKP